MLHKVHSYFVSIRFNRSHSEINVIDLKYETIFPRTFPKTIRIVFEFFTFFFFAFEQKKKKTVFNSIKKRIFFLFLLAYRKAIDNLDNDRKWQTDTAVGKRIGLYKLSGELGKGNFSQVKIGYHELTKGIAQHRAISFLLIIVCRVQINRIK